MARLDEEADDAPKEREAGVDVVPGAHADFSSAEGPASFVPPKGASPPAASSAATASPPAGAVKMRLLALAVAALVLFPLIAKSGIWDPYELDAADFARRIALHVFGAKALELPNAVNTLPTLGDLRMGELPFTSMAYGFARFGLRDWAGRLPLALWGFAGAWILYEFVARLVHRRAGLYAVIALCTMPLYFMQARTMLGDIVTMVAFTAAFAGLGGALLDDVGRGAETSIAAGFAPRAILPRLGWFALGLLGLVAGYFSRGLLIGVATPAIAVALTWIVLVGAGEGRRDAPRHLFGAIALVIGWSALFLGIAAVRRAHADGVVVRILGFALLKKVPNDATFDLVVKQLGHALFPWSAFLPFAIGRLLRAPVYGAAAGPRSGPGVDLVPAPPPDPEIASAMSREIGVRVLLLVGAATAYATFALLAPFTGALPFAAPAVLAAIVAVAVLDLERGAPPSRALGLACLVLGLVLAGDLLHEPEKALTAFVVDKPAFPKSFEQHGGHLLIGVLAIFALVNGLAWFEAQPLGPPRGPRAWVQRMVVAYREGVAELGAVWQGNLIFGLVVVEAALVGLGSMIFVGKYASWAPVKQLSANFADIGLNAWWVAPAILAITPGLLVAVRDGFRVLVRATRLPRASYTMIAALLAGGVQSFVYFPELAGQLSPKEVFDSYAHLHGAGEPLALLGVRARAAAYYAEGEAPSFTEPAKAFEWLTSGTLTDVASVEGVSPNRGAGERAPRRWLVVRAEDLPKLNSLYRAQNGHNLPVVDGRSSQILLVSNRAGATPSESWIDKVVLDEPQHPARALDAMFEDQLQTLGWEVVDLDGKLVDSVVPAKRYHLRFYLRVLKPVTGTWKAFVHIDGLQRRFNGDHAVLDGKYALTLWQPGDTIVDELEFQLEPNFGQGDYTVYYGFFNGDVRFKVTRGQQQENRVIAGLLHVR